MTKNPAFSKTLQIFSFFTLLAAAALRADTMPLTQYVNPFLGTAPSPSSTSGFHWDTGDVFPGAATPQGMVQFSPDTLPTKQAGGYWYPNTLIGAFSLTHFSGRAILYENDIGFMPVSGTLDASSTFNFASYAAGFSHSAERAAAGYYKVTLDNKLTIELTATPRTGMMQATFPAGANAGTILVNVGNSVRGVRNSEVNIANGAELTGFADTTTSGNQVYRIYFSAVFDQPIASYGTWTASALTPGSTGATGSNSGAYVSFDTRLSKVVHVTAGISYVSIANAQLNRTTENSKLTFDTVKQAASNLWNAKLNAIQINDQKASADNLTVFYSELYHTLIHPNVFDDVNGQYIGFDKAVHALAPGHHHYTHIPGWDEYRTHAPLIAFLFPQEYSDIAQSLVDDASQSRGRVPRWVQTNSDSRGMIGDGGSIILAQAYAFGATHFDTASAMAYMDANASGSNGFREKGGQFGSLGWVPDDGSRTLEYSIADMAVAQYANTLRRANLYRKYLASAQNWRNIFNPTTLTITARNAAGGWDDITKGWTEGSQGQYTWLVPFNMAGLFGAMGGNAKVVPRLDDYFGWNPSTQKYTKICSRLGSQNHYAGNEDDESQPWSYLFAGAPWKTQKVVRDIQTDLYRNIPGGSPGNDDAGAMSSWYVFSALGIYPIISGVGGFAIGSPLFASATITREGGNILQITGDNAAPDNPYVQRMQLNGTDSTSLWLPVSAMLRNAKTTLTFTLGPAANPAWAAAAGDVPPSFDTPGH